MPDSPPPRAPAAEVQTVLDGVSGLSALPERLEALSAAFLGVPYLSFPLIGSSREPEQLVTRLDRFDCVTYVETVLALAWSRTVEEFERTLIALRYRDGKVEWIERNHYMTTWLERNSSEGRFVPVLERAWVAAEDVRSLSLLPDYPVRSWHPHYLPPEAVPALAAEARAGDLVCFVSSRADLDTFHVGLLVPSPEGLWLRHAGRSRGAVVQQPLTEFLAGNPTPGMLVARPLSVPRS